MTYSVSSSKEVMVPRFMRRFSFGSCLAFIFCAGASAAESGDHGLLGTDLASAQSHSDYFQFFNLGPIDNSSSSATERLFKPSGGDFRQLVSVYVATDSKQVITGLRVVVARSFIDDPAKGVFARDLIKSSLLSAVDASSAASLNDLATEILYRDRKGTILTREQPRLSKTPSEAYLVVAGTNSDWEDKVGSNKIHLGNRTEEGRSSLVISILTE
jgi:hypothetical protein